MKIIDKLSIKDFRSISRMDIKMESGFLPFVGKNNSGKSNVLRALNLFFNNETEPGRSLNIYEDFHNPSRNIKKLISIKIHFSLPDNFSLQRTIKKGIDDLLGHNFSITKTWTLPSDPFEKGYKLTIYYKKERDDEQIATFDDEYKIRQFLSLITFRYVPNHIHPSKMLLDEQRAIQSELLAKLRRSKKVSRDQQIQIFTELGALSQEFIVPIMNELKKAASDIDKADLSIPSDLGELLFSFAPRLQVHGGETFSAAFHGSGVQSLLTLLVLKYLDSRFSSRFGWHQATIWAIEEPESFLHKDLEHSVASVLAETGKPELSRFQVFCTTHSDVFIRNATVGALCQLKNGKTSVEIKESRSLLDDSAKLGIASYIPPLLFGAPKPLLVVEGPSDKLLINYAYSILKIPNPWDIQDVKTITLGVWEGVDALIKYLKINSDILSTRSIKAPVFVLIDWNESQKKISEIKQTLNVHPTSDVLQWSRINANNDLDDSYTGIERYLSTEAILNANKRSILKVRRPADGDVPLSVDKTSINKIDLAKYICNRKNPADVSIFRKQLGILNDLLTTKQHQIFQVESGDMFSKVRGDSDH